MKPAVQSVGGKAAAQEMPLGLKQRIRSHLLRVFLFLELTALKVKSGVYGTEKQCKISPECRNAFWLTVWD